MPFRSMRTLESWLEEFRGLGYPIPGEIRVIRQDGEDGADTGLVSVQLAYASTVTYIQPETSDLPQWHVTMEPREGIVTLDSADLLNLASELTTVSVLCAFLQAKSQALVAARSA